MIVREDCQRSLSKLVCQDVSQRYFFSILSILQLKILFFVKAGTLHYCQIKGQTRCCFKNEKCDKDMTVVIDKSIESAIGFLEDPDGYLSRLVTENGYDVCHRIDGLDASKCSDECKKLEKSSFANDCAKDGGVFKCCIRFEKTDNISIY